MSSAGNAAWAVILGEHHRLVRMVVGRFRGSIMTSTEAGSLPGSRNLPTLSEARALHQAIDHAALVCARWFGDDPNRLASGSVFDLGAARRGWPSPKRPR
jgi:hypothetical protein